MNQQPIVLNEGQNKGIDLFTQFYLDPEQYVMLLKGHSGTGKSTLVRTFLSMLKELDAMAELLCPGFKPPEIKLTATTHQAAEAMSTAVHGMMPTQTIHSLLGLIVNRDHMTGKTELVVRGGAPIVRDTLILMDEASFADQVLISHLFRQTDNCKFVLMGDHAQLTPVGSTFMPAFNLKGMEIELTQVMRQKKGPLLDLCEGLRATVLGGPWPQIKPDGVEIQHVNRVQFEAMCLEAFKNPEVWGDCKILAYTNERVINFNNFMSAEILGTSDPQAGQRMLVNTAIRNNKVSCNTGEEVMIEEVRPSERFDLKGWDIKLRGKAWLFFLPKHRSDCLARAKLARNDCDYQTAKAIDDSCIDLRPAFACTVNKSQGSTFDTVFIDLDDVCKKVRSPNQLARALYVGLSRARYRVVMTGDM